MSTTREEANAAFVGAIQRGLAERGLYGGALDDWAGAGTQKALEAELGWTLPKKATAPGLETFRGDLDRVHAWEGHHGAPYWPGGASGVTLDPGFDLGHNLESGLHRHYGDILEEREIGECCQVLGLRGAAARDALRARPVLRAIRISRAEAGRVFPHLAAHYWKEIARRFPSLVGPDTPSSIQTALLSLSYNRGAGNKALGVLADPLRDGDWKLVARLIGDMQQDHTLAGIQRRRREEAEMIRGELRERVA